MGTLIGSLFVTHSSHPFQRRSNVDVNGTQIHRHKKCPDMWPNRRLIDLLKIELPIIQAPVAGAMDWELAAEAAAAGALGSLPCAMLNAAQIRQQMAQIRTRTRNPINLNFFCHAPPELNNAREAAWRERLRPYYQELAIDPSAPVPSSNRTAFDATMCEVVEETNPEVVSFHFGLPEPSLLNRLKSEASW